MKRLLVALVLLGFWATPTLADYLFSVPQCLFSVYVNQDGSVRLQYDMIFECSLAGQPIDVVDVGLPHPGYNVANMSATLDGQPMRTIRKSTAIECGVEVPLSPPIAPGERGRFTFEATMPKLVYQDTTRADYASLQITPTWFGSKYLEGTTDLGIVIYLPQTIQPEQILDHSKPFAIKASISGYTVATWRFKEARLDGPHKVGISFPKGNISVVRMTRLGLLYKWWKDNPRVRVGWAVVLLVLLGIMFFRATAGTGWSCFLFLVALLVVGFLASPALELLMLPALVVMWWVSEGSLKAKRGKYLPPIASVEGGGIKRGLTAPEAAVVLELPLARVLSLVIFGLLKKGILEQVSASPLVVRLRPEMDKEQYSERRQAAASAGIVLHSYEQPFLDAIRQAGLVPVQRVDFRSAMKQLIAQTAKRLSGFDLDKTRSYYRSIVARAWAEARNLGEIEQRTAFMDDKLLWLLLADDYGDDFRYWHRQGYYYEPPWVRGPVLGGRAEAPPTPAPTPVGGRTTLSDVSASFAGWAENVSSSLASRLDGVSLGLTKGGTVDLSGVDKVTLDVIEALSSGSGGGGGGGGCACAGCACACACAGGGR